MSFIKCADESETFRAKPATATQLTASQDRSKGTVQVRMGRFEADFALSPMQATILKRMVLAYDDTMVETVLRPILEQHKCFPSIRVIDWCLTNFCKAHPVACTQSDGTRTNMYSAYKAALKFYRRRNFDAFRRRHRIIVRSPHGDLESTIAQLNFYEWSWRSGVIAFCTQNLHVLEADMNRVANQTKEFKSQKKPGDRRRSELTQQSKAKVSIFTAAEG